MIDRNTEEIEDILHESLAFLGEKHVQDSDVLRYGRLTFTAAPKVRYITIFREVN